MAFRNWPGANVLAALGVFSLIGATLSGWMCDRFNPRILLFWYYGLRGLSLILVPLTPFDFVSLSIFAVFYGLDWVATGPATFALANEVFGRRDTPVVVSWIFAGHQVGGAIAAFGAGTAPQPNRRLSFGVYDERARLSARGATGVARNPTRFGSRRSRVMIHQRRRLAILGDGMASSLLPLLPDAYG